MAVGFKRRKICPLVRRRKSPRDDEINLHSSRDDRGEPYQTAKKVNRLIVKYGLEAVEACDVLEIMDIQGIDEVEALSRYRISQENLNLFGSPVSPDVGGMDSTEAYNRGGEEDCDYKDFGVVEDLGRILELEPDEVVSEEWLFWRLYGADQFAHRAQA